MPGFAQIHPDQDEATVQGQWNSSTPWIDTCRSCCGMIATHSSRRRRARRDHRPVFAIRAYHESRGEHRTQVLVPTLTRHQPGQRCRAPGWKS